MAVSQDAIGRRFELLRKRNEQEVQGRTQQEDEAIKRNFARTGGIGSGAQIRVQQQAAEQRAKDVAAAKEGLDVAESGERFQQDQIQAQRDFAKAEREAGQAFARKERLGSEKFSAMEARRQRGFSKNLFDKEMKFKSNQFKEGIRQFNKQFKFAEMDAKRKFDLEKTVQDFNMKMAQQIFDKKSLLNTLLGFDDNSGTFSPVGIMGAGSFGSGSYGSLATMSNSGGGNIFGG